MISSTQLHEIFLDCLYNDDELAAEDSTPKNAVIVAGIIATFGFHPERLESHRTEIQEMLMQLPHQFRQSDGGGWSFLMADTTESGDQWTGMHRSMEQLFTLGEGLGLVKCQLPRELWSALPGGMPYYVILDGVSV